MMNDSMSAVNGTENYFKTIGKFKNLGKAKVLEVGERMECEGADAELAREELINTHLRLVANIALKYKNCGIELDDLIQEGNYGLMLAADKWDYTKGITFSTYATFWIRKYVLRAINENKRAFGVPLQYQEMICKYNRAVEAIYQRTNQEPTDQEIADELGISLEKVENMKLSIECVNVVSTDDEEGAIAEIADSSDDGNVEDTVLQSCMSDYLDQLLSTILDEKEKEVIMRRYGIGYEDEGLSYQKIGNIMGKTRERIRQIEKDAMLKLKIEFENRGLHLGDFFMN